MSLFKTVKSFATGPQGKRALRQAQALNTEANRAKASALVKRLRGGPQARPKPTDPRP